MKKLSFLNYKEGQDNAAFPWDTLYPILLPRNSRLIRPSYQRFPHYLQQYKRKSCSWFNFSRIRHDFVSVWYQLRIWSCFRLPTWDGNFFISIFRTLLSLHWSIFLVVYRASLNYWTILVYFCFVESNYFKSSSSSFTALSFVSSQGHRRFVEVEVFPMVVTDWRIRCRYEVELVMQFMLDKSNLWLYKLGWRIFSDSI